MKRRLILFCLSALSVALILGFWLSGERPPEPSLTLNPPPVNPETTETKASNEYEGEMAATTPPGADLPDSNLAVAVRTHATALTPPQGPSPGEADGATDVSASRELFSQLLRDYQAAGFDPDDRILIEQFLREWNASEAGRAFILDTFFSTQEPELATSLYNLMLDADIKDLKLIVELIHRDGSEQSLQAKTRIVDLIADLTAQDDSPYSREIDEYLAQVALHPDADLRNAAKSRRAWYVTRLQTGNTEVVKEYLLDSSAVVRSEMFELVESRAGAWESADRLEIALTLKSLMYADYLGVTNDERSRIRALIDEMGED